MPAINTFSESYNSLENIIYIVAPEKDIYVVKNQAHPVDKEI